MVGKTQGEAAMIDYEFKIQLLEKELRDLREMQQLMGNRQDANDRWREDVQEALENTVKKVETKLDQLLTVLLRADPNGH
jgi:hypothetical protein